MRKKIYIFLIVILIVNITGCFNPPQFEGLSYQITRSEITAAKTIMAKTADGTTYYTTPEGVNIAFSNVFFPTKEDFITIFDQTPDVSDRHPVANIGPYLGEAIIAIDASMDNPYVVSLDNSELTTLDTFQMELYKEYFGAVVSIVYYEFEMADFSVRFYVNNSNAYEAKDVLIKRESDPTWKFAYQRGTVDTSQSTYLYSYSTELFDQRQATIYQHEWDSHSGENDFLTHMCFISEEDHADGAGSFETLPILLAYGMHSSSDIELSGGGFGRIDKDIIGITFTVAYSFSEEHTCGLQHNFNVAQSGVMHWTDLTRASNNAKKIYPINSVEYNVTYFNDGD